MYAVNVDIRACRKLEDGTTTGPRLNFIFVMAKVTHQLIMEVDEDLRGK